MTTKTKRPAGPALADLAKLADELADIALQARDLAAGIERRLAAVRDMIAKAKAVQS